jgi:hypothetical protein
MGEDDGARLLDLRLVITVPDGSGGGWVGAEAGMRLRHQRHLAGRRCWQRGECRAATAVGDGEGRAVMAG